ncbi:MAG: hypothetical protein AAB036_01215 [Elusimicrobiota bacterium]
MKLRSVMAAAFLFTAGCAVLSPREDADADFEKETNAHESRMQEDRAVSSLASLESVLADYVKTENKIPPTLHKLVPKYIPQIPPLDLPACGRESDRVEVYSPEILRDGQIDGTRIHGTGHWGYVFTGDRVIVFIDCLKPSPKGVPWYQVRGVY